MDSVCRMYPFGGSLSSKESNPKTGLHQCEWSIAWNIVSSGWRRRDHFIHETSTGNHNPLRVFTLDVSIVFFVSRLAEDWLRHSVLVFGFVHLNSGETRLRDDTTGEGRQQIRIVPAQLVSGGEFRVLGYTINIYVSAAYLRVASVFQNKTKYTKTARVHLLGLDF